MKKYECKDCGLAEDNGPCTVPFDDKEQQPTECTYGNGTDCKWELIESSIQDQAKVKILELVEEMDNLRKQVKNLESIIERGVRK